MHTYIMSFQRVCCWFAEAFDLEILFGVMVSAAGPKISGRGGRGAAAVAKGF